MESGKKKNFRFTQSLALTLIGDQKCTSDVGVVVNEIRKDLDSEYVFGFLPNKLRCEAAWSRFLEQHPQVFDSDNKTIEAKKVWESFKFRDGQRVRNFVTRFCLGAGIVGERESNAIWDLTKPPASEEFESVQMFAHFLVEMFEEEEYSENWSEFEKWILTLESLQKPKPNPGMKIQPESEKLAEPDQVKPREVTRDEQHSEDSGTVKDVDWVRDDGETVEVYLARSGTHITIRNIGEIERAVDRFNLVYDENASEDELEYYDPDEVGKEYYIGQADGYDSYSIEFIRKEKPKIKVRRRPANKNSQVNERHEEGGKINIFAKFFEDKEKLRAFKRAFKFSKEKSKMKESASKKPRAMGDPPGVVKTPKGKG